jgi:hypothetical protein
MTRDELESMANRVLTSFKYNAETFNRANPRFLSHKPGRGWQNYTMDNEQARILDSGEAKDLFFGGMREIVKAGGCDATIFVTDTWVGQFTEEGLKHLNEFEPLVTHGYTKLVQLGWMRRQEAFTCVAQTETDVFTITQPYLRSSSGPVTLLKSDRHWGSQQEFGGRTKMFGDCHEGNLGYGSWAKMQEFYDKFGKKHE